MAEEVITYDPEALPNSVDVQNLQVTNEIARQVSQISDGIQYLATQSDDDADTSDSGTVTLVEEQYEQLHYALQTTNTLSVLLLVVLGINCGLVAWLTLSSRWR